MCGFAGIVNFTGGQPPTAPRIDEQLLRRMGAPVAHRGPDGSGTFLSPDGRVGLIHYRLAIVDLPGGAQPMCNEDGTVWVVFNGEIYNHVELRAELEKLGHHFKTDHCDTEAIVHAYEEYGDKCPEHFRGQFAFAIVDLNKKSVFLARDPLGQKPLYWCILPDDRFVFGSSPECIRRHPDAPRGLNTAVFDGYLSRGYGSQSVTCGIGQCDPAERVTPAWREGDGLGTIGAEYWSSANVEDFSGCLPHAKSAVRQRLVEATELRLRADVEVGCFLSGGTDSAVVASIVRRELGKQIRTFTIGTPDPAYDERAPARQVAKELGTEHTEFVVEPEHLLDVLDDLIETVAEPFADSSIVPTYWVAKLTRPHVKVALSGDGGDEAFGGYDRYRAIRLAHRLRWTRPFWKLTWPLWRSLGGAGHRDPWTRLGRLAAGLRVKLPQAYDLWTGLFSRQQIERLVRPGLRQTPPEMPKAITRILGMRFSKDPVADAISDDYTNYLPGDILTKVDRASMRVALEVRSPFLDHKLVELAVSLPSKWKLHGRTSKWILREAFRDIVPPSVWAQPKRGFALPLDRWFRGDLLPLLRESVAFLPPDVFNHACIDELIAAHIAGRAEHSQRLWALLWLGRWWKRFVG